MITTEYIVVVVLCQMCRGLQVMYMMEEEERERKEKLKADLDQMYALAQYLHDHGAPINKKGLDILRRYGYDVSAFED